MRLLASCSLLTLISFSLCYIQFAFTVKFFLIGLHIFPKQSRGLEFERKRWALDLELEASNSGQISPDFESQRGERWVAMERERAGFTSFLGSFPRSTHFFLLSPLYDCSDFQNNTKSGLSGKNGVHLWKLPVFWRIANL